MKAENNNMVKQKTRHGYNYSQLLNEAKPVQTIGGRWKSIVSIRQGRYTEEWNLVTADGGLILSQSLSDVTIFITQ